MRIKFGTTVIDLPSDVDEIQIILHKADGISFCKTSSEDHTGLILKKGGAPTPETKHPLTGFPLAVPRLVALKEISKALEAGVHRQLYKEGR